MSNSSAYRVEKLEGTKNYGTWKYAMKMLLIKEKLWKAIVNETIDDETDQQALAAIVLNIFPNIYVRTKSAKTAKEAWTKLEKAFESTGLRRQIMLDRQLYSTKFSDFSNMEGYINRMLEIQNELKGVGRDVSDEYMAFKLLANLPEEFDSLVIAIENSGKDLVLDNVIMSLLQEETRRNEEPTKSESALVSKQKKVFYDHSKKNSKNCYICGKPGHFSKFCRYRKQKDEKEKKFFEKRAYVSFKTNGGVADQNWYLDSGASCHMSPQKEFFDDVKEVRNWNIESVDGTIISPKGVGNVDLCVNIGNKTEEIILHDVLYMPNSKINLLSVGKITDKGSEVIFTKSKCIIRDKNTKEIIGKGSRNENGLYSLDIFQNKVWISKTLSDYDLWHKRLGHLSEGGIQKLQKGLVSGLPKIYPNLIKFVKIA